mgnify:FL=1
MITKKHGIGKKNPLKITRTTTRLDKKYLIVLLISYPHRTYLTPYSATIYTLCSYIKQ